MGCNCVKSENHSQLQTQPEPTSPEGNFAEPTSDVLSCRHESRTQVKSEDLQYSTRDRALDFSSPDVIQPPALLQVRALPRKVSLVNAEESNVVECNVDDMMRLLSCEHNVSLEQALEALQWSNFDPEEAAALINQTSEIERYEREELLSTAGGAGFCSDDPSKRERLLNLFLFSRTQAASHHPAVIPAGVAKNEMDAKKVKKALSEELKQDMSRKRPLSEEPSQMQYPTMKPSATPSAEEVVVPDSAPGKMVRRDCFTSGLSALTPHSRRMAYFASKYDVKKSVSEVSSPMPHQPLLPKSSTQATDVIIESSVVGHYMMPPWEASDPDVRNNFWVDSPAHKVLRQEPPTFLIEEVHAKVNLNQKCIAQDASSPHGSDPTMITKPLPGDSIQHETVLQDQCTFSNQVSPPCAGIEDCCSALGDGWDRLGDDKWTDPDGRIALSEKQRNKIHEWRRITELRVPYPSSKDAQGRKDHRTASNIIGPDGNYLNPGDSLQPLMLLDWPRAQVIRQGFVGDCSFLSSLASLARYGRRQRVPIISSLIYPQVQRVNDKGALEILPIINENGMYACKLHFNGVSRKVLVDDFVPIRRDGKLLAAHSANKREMWVTVLEKAFVKLMGGSYFMHGSNPGADLYHLTGWIPETIPFRKDIHTGSPTFHSPVVTGGEESSQLSKDPKWDFVWKHLHLGFSQGSCVACLGTSEVMDATPSGLDFPEGVSISSGIVARHAYSILSCKEVLGKRLLYVRNPWACVRWKGMFSPGCSSWTPDLSAALQYDSRAALKSDNGSFWIQWQDVVRWFSHLYLCWNRSFFPFEETLHSRWGVCPHMHTSLLIDDSHSVAYNPQFHLRIAPLITEDLSTSEELEDDLTDIWILLSRHVRDRKKDLFQKYIAIHVFASSERVCCPPLPTQQGVYSNGECALMRIRARRRRVSARSLSPELLHHWRSALARQKVCKASPPPAIDSSSSGGNPPVLEDQDFVLVVSQYSQKGTFNFTLKVFGSAPMMVKEIPVLVPSSDWTTLSDIGKWTQSTAGGCSNDIWSFFRNPHYRLNVPQPCTARFFLECPSELSVNIRLLQASFSSARLLRTGKALSSGPYRAACCYLEAELTTGSHTLILSSFRAGDCGKYQLRVHVSIPPSKASTLVALSQRLLDLPRQQALLLPTGIITHDFLANAGDVPEDHVSYELSLFPLPSPYAFPPPSHFKVHSCYGGSPNHKFFGLFRLQTEEPFATLTLRLEVKSMTPRTVYPSMVVLYVMSCSHSLALRNTQDPIAEAGLVPFDVTTVPHQLPFASNTHLGIIMKSNLEGGQSRTGNTPSTAAAQLYAKQGLLCLSSLQIFHPSIVQGSYYILVSTLPPLIKRTRRWATSLDYIANGAFRLHAISAQKLILSAL